MLRLGCCCAIEAGCGGAWFHDGADDAHHCLKPVKKMGQVRQWVWVCSSPWELLINHGLYHQYEVAWNIFMSLTWRVFQRLLPLLVLDLGPPSPHWQGLPGHQCLCRQLQGWQGKDVPGLECPCLLNSGCGAASGPVQRLEHCNPVRR